MSALSKIRNVGFDVALDGDCFKITPASALTMQQREVLKLHKAEIIIELQEQVEWIELPENFTPDALIVTCYTPDGKPIEVVATNAEHAEFLRRMKLNRT